MVMLRLRYPWLWSFLGWSLVVAVLVGSLMPGDLVGDYRISDKLVHAGSYFLLMVWFAGLYPRRLHVLIALVLFALGVAIELLQGAIASRSFDPMDVVANTAGILLGLGLSLWLLAGWCQRMERRWLT